MSSSYYHGRQTAWTGAASGSDRPGAQKVNDLMSRIRGALGNAVVWGAAWAAGSIVLLTLFVLLGLVPAVPPGMALLQIAARFGVAGVAVGAGFSGFLAYVYRDERLATIRSVPFVLGGAVVSAIIAPFAGLPALLGSILGAGTAAFTLTAAKRAERQALADPGYDGLLGP